MLGPSSDGGYYLLGLKAAHRRMFEDIDWSTERVAEQTLQRAREIGLDVHILPVWYDVDDVDGLRRLDAELNGEDERRHGAHSPHYADTDGKIDAANWREIAISAAGSIGSCRSTKRAPEPARSSQSNQRSERR